MFLLAVARYGSLAHQHESIDRFDHALGERVAEFEAFECATCDVFCIVQAGMVPAFELKAALCQHGSHAADLGLALGDCIGLAEVQSLFRCVEQVHREGFLEVDPALHVVGHGEVLDF